MKPAYHFAGLRQVAPIVYAASSPIIRSIRPVHAFKSASISARLRGGSHTWKCRLKGISLPHNAHLVIIGHFPGGLTGQCLFEDGDFHPALIKDPIVRADQADHFELLS